MTKAVLRVLREARSPLSARQIAVALVEGRGMDAADPMLIDRFSRRAKDCLKRRSKVGVVARIVAPGNRVFWTLI